MRRRVFTLVSTVAFILLTSKAWAEPQLDIETQVLRGGKRILFSLFQHDVPSMMPCHYNFFAADKETDLSSLPGKGISIATFERDESLLEIMVSHLRSISREAIGKRTVSVYVRMLMFCSAEEFYLSEIHELILPTRPGGKVKDVDRTIRRMKYRIRWAEEVPGWNTGQ